MNREQWGTYRLAFAEVQRLCGIPDAQQDGLPGPKSTAAFAALADTVREEIRAKDSARVIRSEGWPFEVRVVGADLVIDGTTATWFGGDADPDDNGETASGVRTKGNRGVMGCALPVVGGHRSTKGSPLAFPAPGMRPGIPWKTPVEVTYGGKSITVPLLDNGPAKWVQNSGEGGKAIDLTPAAMAELAGTGRYANGNPKRGLIHPVKVRIIGGAKYVA